MCVCIYIYIYIYTHIHTYLHTHMHTYIQGEEGEDSQCMWVLIDGFVKAIKTNEKGKEERIFSQRAPGVYICMCICMYVWIYVYVCVCMYVGAHRRVCEGHKNQ